MMYLIALLVVLVAVTPIVIRWLRVPIPPRPETTITVADSPAKFVVGNRIAVGDEYFIVTAIHDQTLTVRGASVGAGRQWRWQR